MNLSDVLRDRIAENYEGVRTLSRRGAIIRSLSLALMLGPFLFGVSRAEDGLMGGVFLLWSLTAMVSLIGFGIGELVSAQGKVLSSLIEFGITSSGALSEAARIELLEQRACKGPGLNLGLQTARFSGRPLEDEEARHQSPIAALIATPISAYSHFTPLPRLERRPARPSRRRHH